MTKSGEIVGPANGGERIPVAEPWVVIFGNHSWGSDNSGVYARHVDQMLADRGYGDRRVHVVQDIEDIEAVFDRGANDRSPDVVIALGLMYYADDRSIRRRGTINTPLDTIEAFSSEHGTPLVVVGGDTPLSDVSNGVAANLEGCPLLAGSTYHRYFDDGTWVPPPH